MSVCGEIFHDHNHMTRLIIMIIMSYYLLKMVVYFDTHIIILSKFNKNKRTSEKRWQLTHFVMWRKY